MSKKSKDFNHLNAAVPVLAEAAAVRKAESDKAEQAQAATKLAKKMISVGKRGVR